MLGLRDQMMSADIGVQRAQTIRQSSTALLTIDSADRFASQIDRRVVSAWTPASLLPLPYNFSAYDFRIIKSESIMNGFFTRLAVSEITFPWAVPNINAFSSSVFVKYQIAPAPPVSSFMTIPTNFYKPSDIAAFIQNYVRNLVTDLSGFTMTYGAAPFPFTFSYATNNPAVTIAFIPDSYNDSLYNNNNLIPQLFDLLGFDTSSQTLSTTGRGNPTLCQFTRYVDIVCPQLTYNQSLKDTSSQRTVRDSLCRIYLGDADGKSTATVNSDDPNFCPPGCAPTTIYRNFSTPKQIQWSPNQPVSGSLQFEVYDDNGILLSSYVTNNFFGLDWSMTLLVTEN
jgi:hypothetical protein